MLVVHQKTNVSDSLGDSRAEINQDWIKGFGGVNLFTTAPAVLAVKSVVESRVPGLWRVNDCGSEWL